MCRDMNTEQNGDNPLSQWLPETILDKYAVYNYNHAAEILSQSFTAEFHEILAVLSSLTISRKDILIAGGNESPIPKKFSLELEPNGWKEIRISGDLLIKFYPRRGIRKGSFDETPYDEKIISNYIDGHNIDFIKGRVAVDIEWNSKDQTFDR